MLEYCTVAYEVEVPVFEHQETGNEVEVDGEMVPEIESVQVGTEMEERKLFFKQVLVRNWYLRRRLGEKGSAWTKAMLESLGTDRQNFKPEVVGDGSQPEQVPELNEGDIVKGEKTWTIHGHEGEYKTKKAAEEAWDAYLADQEKQAETLDSEENKSNDLSSETQPDSVASDESNQNDLPPETQPEKGAEGETQPDEDANADGEDEAWG